MREAQAIAAQATHARTDAAQNLADVINRRVQQRRVPHAPAFLAGTPFIWPAETSPRFLCKYSSATIGFRSRCGRKAAQLHKLSRSTRPAVWNLLTSALSPLRARLSPVGPREPIPISKRNVVVPTGYSKWFFCTPIRLYGGIFLAATALKIPARSVFGGLSTVNAVAAIMVSISPA